MNLQDKGHYWDRETLRRVVRIKELTRIVGLSRSTIYNKLNPKSKGYDPEFPKPLRLGASSVGWLLSSVDQWLISRIN
ncbi:MAG: helix-turn-helix transcriptional regulator [Shewanella sp.]|uniref:helix-turn-helix transcriptional regulator n=1 Tax=Aeromonas veronii TaxID=654 RepID=UPI003D23302E